MTRFADREKARALRSQGKSYSEIKGVLAISKSTLSGWLQDMPLSKAQIRQLRDLNPRRIEHFRATMQKKREDRLQEISQKINKEIGTLTKRELFIGGLYLYWGEGMKAKKGTVGISNTDPAVVKTFIEWLKIVDVPKEKLVAHVHLYSDMNIHKEIRYWSETLSLSTKQFRKPYIKTSTLVGLTYKNGYGHGTCNLLFENMALWEYIMMALKYLREQHTRP